MVSLMLPNLVQSGIISKKAVKKIDQIMIPEFFWIVFRILTKIR